MKKMTACPDMLIPTAFATIPAPSCMHGVTSSASDGDNRESGRPASHDFRRQNAFTSPFMKSIANEDKPTSQPGGWNMFSTIMGNLRTVTAAAALFAGSIVGVGSVQAAPLFDITGTPFTALQDNDVLNGPGIGVSGTPTFREGSVGAPNNTTITLRRLGWEGAAEVRVFCGGQAGGRCDLKAQGSTFPDPPNAAKLSRFPLPGASTGDPDATWTHTFTNNNDNVFLRLISFFNGVELSNINNRNPENTARPPGVPSLIFAYIDEQNRYSSSPTNRVIFGYDDGGNNIDDNHDDYMGVLTVTPIPGAVWLFGTAALGLAAVHRRRKAAAAAV